MIILVPACSFQTNIRVSMPHLSKFQHIINMLRGVISVIHAWFKETALQVVKCLLSFDNVVRTSIIDYSSSIECIVSNCSLYWFRSQTIKQHYIFALRQAKVPGARVNNAAHSLLLKILRKYMKRSISLFFLCFCTDRVQWCKLKKRANSSSLRYNENRRKST